MGRDGVYYQEPSCEDSGVVSYSYSLPVPLLCPVDIYDCAVSAGCNRASQYSDVHTKSPSIQAVMPKFRLSLSQKAPSFKPHYSCGCQKVNSQNVPAIVNPTVSAVCPLLCPSAYSWTCKGVLHQQCNDEMHIESTSSTKSTGLWSIVLWILYCVLCQWGSF